MSLVATNNSRKFSILKDIYEVDSFSERKVLFSGGQDSTFILYTLASFINEHPRFNSPNNINENFTIQCYYIKTTQFGNYLQIREEVARIKIKEFIEKKFPRIKITLTPVDFSNLEISAVGHAQVAVMPILSLLLEEHSRLYLGQGVTDAVTVEIQDCGKTKVEIFKDVFNGFTKLASKYDIKSVFPLIESGITRAIIQDYLEEVGLLNLCTWCNNETQFDTDYRICVCSKCAGHRREYNTHLQEC